MYSILASKIENAYPLIEKKLAEHITNKTKVAVIAWTFPNEINKDEFEKEWFPVDGKRYNKYVAPLLKLGVERNNVFILNCYDNDIDGFKKTIEESDILVIAGGNPEMLYSKVTQDTELLYCIKHYKGIVIGSSAGAELQLRRYFITAKNNYYKYFAFYDGFGILNNPFYFDVHSINNRFYLDKLQKVANEKGKNVYAIFNDGVVIYNRVNGEIELVGHVKACVPKID